MSNRTFWSVAAVLGIVILVLANPRTPEETVVHAPAPAEEVAAAAADLAAEQAPAEPASEAEPSADPADWTAPRTPWGDPDLQGVWTNATLTPIERPADLGDQAVLTAEEAAELEVRSAESRAASDRFIPGNVGAYNQFWMDSGKNVTEDRRTALITDPPDGRIPWTEAGRERLESDLARYGVGPFDTYEDADTGERCLTDGLPLVPLQGYNMNYHILQSPGWVAILNEMFHEYRMIPVDGRGSSTPTSARCSATPAAGGRATRWWSRRPTSRTSGTSCGARPGGGRGPGCISSSGSPGSTTRPSTTSSR